MEAAPIRGSQVDAVPAQPATAPRRDETGDPPRQPPTLALLKGGAGADTAARRQRRASAGTMYIGPKVPWPPPSYVRFPVTYAETPQGLKAAECDLARLLEIHDGYADQPNISKIWQGYVDEKAAAVDRQRLALERLRAAIDLQTPAAPARVPD